METMKKVKNLIGNRDSKKVANNTYLKKRGDSIALMLHQTDIMTFNPDGSIIFNSGGWKTATTKDRINQFSPIGIYQKKGVWYFQDGSIFQDGCILKNGKLKGTLPPKEDKKNRRLLKDAKNYSVSFVDSFLNGEVPAPSNGDCWGCLMVTEDNQTPMGGKDHILQHIKEGYYVPSLLVRAIERFTVSPCAKDSLAYMWNPSVKDSIPEFVKIIAKEQIGKSIYRYVKKELGFSC